MEFEKIIGIVSLAFGTISLGAYVLLALGKRPIKFFRKLEPMQQKFGKYPGTVIHFTAYVIVPLLAGLVLWLGAP